MQTKLSAPLRTLPKITTSTSPNAYPFDSMVMVGGCNTTIRSTELAKVQELLKDTSNCNGITLRDEKFKLHEASLGRVKGWGNTVMGKRKGRLENIRLRNEEAEQRRRDVDEDWRVLQIKEHEDACEKARLSLMRGHTDVRKLISDVGLASVVVERDLQVKRRARQENLERRIENGWSKVLRDGMVRDAKKEMEEQRKRREEAKTFGKFLEVQIKEGQELREKMRKDDVEFYRKQARVYDEKKGQAVIKKVVEDSQSVILANKRERELKKRQELARLEADNARFNAVKDLIAVKKKEMERMKLERRQSVIESIGQRQWEVAQEEGRKRALVEQKLMHAHDSDGARRGAFEEEGRRRRLEEIEAFTSGRREIVNAQRREIKRERELDAEEIKRDAIAFAAERDLKKMKKKSEKEALLTFLSAQMLENGQRRHPIANCVPLEDHEKSDKEFLEYAGALAKEWDRMGRDSGVIWKAVEKIRTTGRREGGRNFDSKAKPDNGNSFDRLGFA